ncbi:MAG: protein-glutamate O-methyltransferase CheR [Campylobacterales bacterium]|nr:protein-glutamate O-methyltransferase CheR [Campylobacterales bacterium]
MFSWFKRKRESLAPIERIRTEDFTKTTELYHYFTNLTGIHFDQKESITTPKLIRFAQGQGCNSFGELMEKLRSDSSVREALINLLTVNETYFFREKGQLDFLAHHSCMVSTPLRILCAPGSSGEEAYSIAIILAESDFPLSHVQIVSIDINTEATNRARAGVYTNRALHRLPAPLKERYFVAEGTSYRVDETIKKVVDFRSCNIFEAEFLELGFFDTIFSRNMLIYFDLPTIEKAVNQLKKAARNDQTLFFFGHADLLTTPSGLESRVEEGIKYYTLKK